MYVLGKSMGMHGMGWHTVFRSTDEKPKVTWKLMKRVLGYAKPYRWKLAGMLTILLFSTGLAFKFAKLNSDKIKINKYNCINNNLIYIINENYKSQNKSISLHK